MSMNPINTTLVPCSQSRIGTSATTGRLHNLTCQLQGQTYNVVEMSRNCHDNFKTVVTEFADCIAPKYKDKYVANQVAMHERLHGTETRGKETPYILTLNIPSQQKRYIAHIGKTTADSTMRFCEDNHLKTTEHMTFIHKNHGAFEIHNPRYTDDTEPKDANSEVSLVVNPVSELSDSDTDSGSEGFEPTLFLGAMKKFSTFQRLLYQFNNEHDQNLSFSNGGN